ncbi:hypothetical protein PCC6912_01610 [Chlorogloeopsis fritschii PCC 6912]|uniref:Uncharacterized protein n=2 Tax=Chlorogloeopsis fritschii TaxID=1124 RepID=A0A433NR72_CHLFR|nr:hypothetical protein PCC6912_01610 [Chlorogloeopsis fritschii PCC 6912]
MLANTAIQKNKVFMQIVPLAIGRAIAIEYTRGRAIIVGWALPNFPQIPILGCEQCPPYALLERSHQYKFFSNSVEKHWNY